MVSLNKLIYKTNLSFLKLAKNQKFTCNELKRMNLKTAFNTIKLTINFKILNKSKSNSTKREFKITTITLTSIRCRLKTNTSQNSYKKILFKKIFKIIRKLTTKKSPSWKLLTSFKIFKWTESPCPK